MGSDAKHLGTIFNSSNLLRSSGPDTDPARHRQIVTRAVDMGVGILAHVVGLPDPVYYRSDVATQIDAHLAEAHVNLGYLKRGETPPEVDALRRLIGAGTDPLSIATEVCRERGVAIVASYHMNSEGYYGEQLNLSDFGRSHRHLAIPDKSCLDPVHAEVYRHRMAIFREMAEMYDVDGIEFDFKRSYYMISDPLENHPVLTAMVRDT